MKIIKYPDNTSYVQQDTSEDVVTFRLNSYEDLWHLNQFIDAYNNFNDGKKPTIVIPNLIDAQADKRFNSGESSGLKLVCKFLNQMNANFRIFHPHNPEVVEALIDNVVIIDNNTFIAKVFVELSGSSNYGSITTGEILKDNLILMSSDAGGFKPLMKLCDKLKWEGETASASKSRSYENSKSTLHQIVPIRDFNGKDILIVDDICVYGGTFKGLSNILKQRNCGKLYLAISHMTVQNLGEDPVTNYFDKVFTTNSKYNNYFTPNSDEYANSLGPQPKNLEIIKIF